MAEETSTKLAVLLERCGIFNREQIAALLARQGRGERSITEDALEHGYAREMPLLEALAKAMEIPFVRLVDASIPREILELLPAKAIFQYR